MGAAQVPVQGWAGLAHERIKERAQVLPGGTAFQTDAGACADYDSVIGMNTHISVARFASRLPGERQTPATGPATVCGVMVETDDRTGLALRIEPIRVGGRLKPAMPEV